MILDNTKSRILQYLEFKGISKSQFYLELGIKRGLLDSDKMNSTVTDNIVAKILVTYTDINPMWLLTGEVPMLRDNIISKESEQECNLNTEPLLGEAVAYYKMYERKDEENKALLKQIGCLEERIRVLEAQEKEPGWKISKMSEDFTSQSSGDYGENSLSTRNPTTSEISSGLRT